VVSPATGKGHLPRAHHGPVWRAVWSPRLLVDEISQLVPIADRGTVL
jgi:hypothetical protein